MQAIQQLRAQALAAGTLQSTPQQQVITQNGTIYIEPVNPQIIYVPQYDPGLVYVRQPGYYFGPYITFSIGFAIGNWLNNDCDWRNHWISAGQGWQHNWRRDNRGQWIRNRPVYRGNDRQFVPAQRVPQRWTRNPREPLPALPPNMAPRGALRQYRGWPTTPPMNRPAPGFHPGNSPRQFAPPSAVFGGNYRNYNNISRVENRGQRSLQSYQNFQHHGLQNRSEYRAPQVPRQAPPALRGMNSYRQVQQDSRRGRQSMRH